MLTGFVSIATAFHRRQREERRRRGHSYSSSKKRRSSSHLVWRNVDLTQPADITWKDRDQYVTKWVYKVVTRAGACDFVSDMIFYVGKGSVIDNRNVGVSSSCVVQLTENVPKHKNYKIYF